MARLSYVEKDGAQPDQEKILAQVTQKSGKIANLWKLWAHSPMTLETFMPFYKTLMTKASLDGKLRELAYVKTSMINGCAYCAGPHRTVGLKLGVTEQQLQELENFESSSLFSATEKAVLRYAEELTRHVKTSDESMKELKKHLDEAQIVDLTLTIGVANLTNRFNVSLGTDPD
jgi:uncharacterized peroxidase-related enzyme